jgi:hypothetical protein
MSPIITDYLREFEVLKVTNIFQSRSFLLNWENTKTHIRCSLAAPIRV